MKPNLIERSNAALSNVLSHATQLQIERGEGPILLITREKSIWTLGLALLLIQPAIVIHRWLRPFRAIGNTATWLRGGCIL